MPAMTAREPTAIPNPIGPRAATHAVPAYVVIEYAMEVATTPPVIPEVPSL